MSRYALQNGLKLIEYLVVIQPTYGSPYGFSVWAVDAYSAQEQIRKYVPSTEAVLEVLELPG